MGEIDIEWGTTPTLHAIFDGAKSFGLTDAEVWSTVDGTLCGAGIDATVSEYLEELSGALARRILAKERSDSPD